MSPRKVDRIGHDDLGDADGMFRVDEEAGELIIVVNDDLTRTERTDLIRKVKDETRKRPRTPGMIGVPAAAAAAGAVRRGSAQAVTHTTGAVASVAGVAVAGAIVSSAVISGHGGTATPAAAAAHHPGASMRRPAATAPAAWTVGRHRRTGTADARNAAPVPSPTPTSTAPSSPPPTYPPPPPPGPGPRQCVPPLNGPGQGLPQWLARLVREWEHAHPGQPLPQWLEYLIHHPAPAEPPWVRRMLSRTPLLGGHTPLL